MVGGNGEDVPGCSHVDVRVDYYTMMKRVTSRRAPPWTRRREADADAEYRHT
jgi:hypothetical protein